MCWKINNLVLLGYSVRFAFTSEDFLEFRTYFFNWYPEEDMGNISKWKESLVDRTISKQNNNLMQRVYGKSASTPINEKQDGSEDEESDDEFFKLKGEGNKV